MQRDKSGERRRTAEGGRAETANTERVFETIFQEHWEKTWLAGYRLTGDPDEAEDIALEAFVRLHHNLARGIENPGGWLYRAVTRLGLNNIRARKRREHYRRGEPDAEKAAADPASVYEQQLQAEHIRQIAGEDEAEVRSAAGAQGHGLRLRRNRRNPGREALLGGNVTRPRPERV